MVKCRVNNFPCSISKVNQIDCVRPQALDLLLEKMQEAGLDFSRIRALSGSGQVSQEHCNTWEEVRHSSGAW